MPQRRTLIAWLVFGLLLIPTALLAADVAKTKLFDADPALGNPQLADDGFLDVTAAPFNADPTGQRDATEAIRQAVVYARDNVMVTYFPPGTYTISDTIRCEQLGRGLTKDKRLLEMGLGKWSTRFIPCVLMGSRSGEARPRIVLAPNSPGYGDVNRRKYMIHMFRTKRGPPNAISQRRQPNSSFNNQFIGIDIEIGKGNPAAVAIRHRAAQGSSIQDCTIDATNGLVGMEAAPGSGGSCFNVTIIGGKIGADLMEVQPAPTIVGFNFLKQTGTAIRYGGWQSLTAVGTRIEMDGPGPAIVTLRSSSKLGGGGKVVVDGRTEYHSMNGQLNLIDSVITFQKPGDHVAIEAAATVHLNNVYMKNAKAMCRFREDGETLAGVDDGWARVGQYTHAVDPGRVRPYPHQPPVLVFPYTSSIFVDGKKLTGKTLGDPVEKGPTPPTDLQSRHVWDGDFPSWETPGAVNVRCAPYLAKGDAKSDDYATLQKAVDENEIVFLPRGVYCLSQTLKLKPNTKLIGLTNHTTHLVAGIPGQVDCAFTTATTAMPTVESADAADADTVLAFMRVRGAGINGYCLKWQAGRKSVVRSVEFRVSRQAVVPSVVVANNGGGKWYNYHHGETVKTKEPGYRRLLVENTREPLAFYMFNLEHAYYQEAHAEFRNAKNVFLYGTKGETYNTLLWFRDCDNVAVFGNAGNSNSLNSPAIFRIENTPNFMLVNLVDRTRKAKHYNWHMLAEEADGETILTEPLERPALYQRGTVTRR